MTAVILLLVVSLDRLTKILVVNNLSLGQSFPVIKNIFYLTLVYNRGAAFGILRNQTIFFIIVAIFTAIIIVLNLKKSRSFLNRLALSLILAGALGNLIDRIHFGYVIDFLDFRIWPVFNIADSAITVGAALLSYAIIKKR